MRERVAMIRSLEEEFDRPIGILVDLQGPKLRVGEFESGGVQLRKGDAFTLDADPTLGDQTRVYLPHPEILGSLQPGHRVLIDDGKVLLRVAAVAPGRADTIVEVAGRISNKKGVSLPDTTHPDLGDDRQGSRRSRRGAGGEHRLDRALVRAAPRGRDRGQEDRRRPRAGDGQDREAAGDRSVSTTSSPSPTR